MAVKNKELIHQLFMQGKTYKEIAEIIGSNAAAVAQRISLYRKKEPEFWPRLRKYTEPLKVEVETYRCINCEIIFAVEKESDFANDGTCPICWEKEHLQAIGINHLKVNEGKVS